MNEFEWMARAICPGLTSLFFPEQGETNSAEMAKQVCARCPVSRECLEYAIVNEVFGVWGGTTERERRRIRKRRRLDS